MAPFIIVIIFLEIYFEKPRKDKTQKIRFAIGYVIFAYFTILLEIYFKLSESCPEFKGLSSDSIGITVCSRRGNTTNLLEINFDWVIFKCGYFLQRLKGIFSDLFIGCLTGQEYFFHYEVSLRLNLEIVVRIRNTIWQSSNSQSCWFNTLRILSNVFGQSWQYQVFGCVIKIIWLKFITDVTQSRQRRQFDVHIRTLSVGAQTWNKLVPFVPRNLNSGYGC